MLVLDISYCLIKSCLVFFNDCDLFCLELRPPVCETSEPFLRYFCRKSYLPVKKGLVETNLFQTWQRQVDHSYRDVLIKCNYCTGHWQRGHLPVHHVSQMRRLLTEGPSESSEAFDWSWSRFGHGPLILFLWNVLLEFWESWATMNMFSCQTSWKEHIA